MTPLNVRDRNIPTDKDPNVPKHSEQILIVEQTFIIHSDVWQSYDQFVYGCGIGSDRAIFHVTRTAAEPSGN